MSARIDVINPSCVAQSDDTQGQQSVLCLGNQALVLAHLVIDPPTLATDASIALRRSLVTSATHRVFYCLAHETKTLAQSSCRDTASGTDTCFSLYPEHFERICGAVILLPLW